MTALREFGTLAADIPAAAQQLALIQAVYGDRRDIAETLVGTDGRVTEWLHQPTSWPPSWAAIVTSDGRKYLVIAGTTNASHWLAHGVGTIFGEEIEERVVAQGQHLVAWRTIRPDVVRAWGGLADGDRVFISGHSYGGSVGHMAAFDLAANIGNGNVQLMTFGGPQSYSRGYSGPAPDVYWRIRSPGDIVPYLPGESFVPWLLGFTPAGDFSSTFTRWIHYGRNVYIGPGGTIDSAVPVPSPLPDGVQFGEIAEHSTRNYWGRLRAYYLRTGGPPAMSQALTLGDLAWRGGSTQELVELPGWVVNPDGSISPVPETVQPLVAQGVTPMANNAGLLTGGTPVEVSIFFEWGKQGWDETWIAYIGGNINTKDFALEWAANLANERRKFLGVPVNITYIRASRVDARNDAAILEAADDVRLGPGKRDAIMSNLTDAYLTRVEDFNGNVHAMRFFRGVVNADLADPSTNPDGRVAIPAAAKVRFQAFADWLCQPRFIGQNPSTRVDPAIRSYSKGVDAPLVNVSRITINTAGYVQIQVPAGLSNLAIGDTAMLEVKRQKCVRGLAGRWLVYNKTPGTEFDTFALRKKFCCAADELDTAVATVRKYVRAYYAINSCKVVRTGQRDTGRPFGGIPGLHKGKCC